MQNKQIGSKFKIELSKAVILTLGVAMIIMLLVIKYFAEQQAKERLSRDLKMVGDIIGNRSIAALYFLDKNQAEKNLASANYHESIERLCLYSADGILFASYSRDSSEIESCSQKHRQIRNLSKSSEDEQLEKGSVILQTKKFFDLHLMIFDGKENIGTLTVLGNTRALNAAQSELLSILIITFLTVIVGAYVLIQILLSRALKPLGSLFETTKLIATDHFSGKRAQKYKDDEIGALVDVFNKMLDNIEQSHTEVTESEERFRTLAASAPIGIFLMDADFRRVYVNDRWREITGLTLEAKKEDYIKNIEAQDLHRYQQTYQSVAEHHRKGWVEYQFHRPDSEVRNVTLMEYIAPIETIHDNETITGFVGSILDVTDLRQARHELEKLAYYDPLTKLPNRRNFRDYLSYHINKAGEEGSFLAILMIDLDNFKRINDTLGHDAGDRLLVVLADRLRKRLHNDDLVARVGGDEFYVVLQDVPTLPIVGRIAKRIIEATSEPIEIKNHVVEVTASIGIARYPLDAESSEELMRNVDIALYRAKSAGKNQIAYFSSELDDELKEKLRMETKLRKATLDGELELFFQPQYNALNKTFSWAEVLLRWRDEEDGLISPFKFIPLAEETGLITEIDYWVLKNSCESWSKNQARLRELGIKGLSINLSARQFYSKQLIELVKSIFNEFGITPGHICFELTESLVIEDVDSAITTMKELMRLGCKLSIDDFGTGYSSLSYLRKFPINSFKIDKSFITDISIDESNLAITSAIIAMADKLDLNVVAEGIETEEQKLLLLGQGCYMMQGYYFARPMPEEDLLKGEWLETGGHKTHRWQNMI